MLEIAHYLIVAPKNGAMRHKTFVSKCPQSTDAARQSWDREAEVRNAELVENSSISKAEKQLHWHHTALWTCVRKLVEAFDSKGLNIWTVTLINYEQKGNQKKTI